MKTVRFASALGAFFALMTSGAGASTISIDNFSFELPGTSGFQNSIANWASSSSSFTGVYLPGSFGDSPAPNGSQAAFVNPGNFITTVGATNTINSSTLAAGTYTLTVYVDNRGASDSATIDLLAGGTVVGTATVTPPNLNAPWDLVTVSVVATSATAGFGQSLGIKLIANAASNSASVDFDNVQLSFVAAATPLPAALPLFATGLGALGLLARRRKRKAALAA